VSEIYWQLDSLTPSAITNDALLTTPPNLSDFGQIFGFEVTGPSSPQREYLLRGTVTSIVEAPAVIPQRPSTTVEKAIQISWPSSLGCFYQIQSAEDEITWFNVGEPILGDGTTLSGFFRLNKDKKISYRVNIADLSQ
jgi:hypothetical protein